MINQIVASEDVPIAYYTLLAEFDIDTGSCLRARYPTGEEEEDTPVEGGNLLTQHVQEDGTHYSIEAEDFDIDSYGSYCANHMLPDGAEKQAVCRGVFILNRPNPRLVERFPVYCFVPEPNSSQLESTAIKKWMRNAATATFFSNEILHRDKASTEISLHWRGHIIFGPKKVSVESDALQVLPTLPPSALTFVQQLQRRLASLEAETLTGTSSGIGVGGLHNSNYTNNSGNNNAGGGYGVGLSSSGGATQMNREELTHANVSAALIPSYSFSVLRVGAVCYGLLMQSSHLDRLMRSVQQEGTNRGVGKGGKDITPEGAEQKDLVMPPLYGLCAVVTRTDATARRGGISKSVALLGPTLGLLEPFFPILVETALQCCDVKGKTEDAVAQQVSVLRRCHEAVNGAMRLLLRCPTGTKHGVFEEEVIRLCTENPRSTLVSYTTEPFGTPHCIRVPRSPESCELSFSRYGLGQMLEICGSSFWTVLMAILLEKRIVILSRKGLPNDVCEAALSFGLIGNLLDPDFIVKKVFPYTSVSGFQHFTDISGYIVGTLNPIFETQQAWWDVLCDLDNKCVHLCSEGGKKLAAGDAPDWATGYSSNGLSDGGGKASHEAIFVRDLLTRIHRMTLLRAGLNARHHAVRLALEEFFALFLFLSEAHEDGDGEKDNKGGGNSGVSGEAGWSPRCLTQMFLTPLHVRLRARAQLGAMLDLAPRCFLLPGEDPSILLLAATLRRASSCSKEELLRSLSRLHACVQSDEDALRLLRRMPLAMDGLSPLAMQLLHPAPPVRRAALQLMQRIESFPVGSAAITSLNNFLLLVYEESRREAS